MKVVHLIDGQIRHAKSFCTWSFINFFIAEGTKNISQVTCKRCLKAIEKERKSLLDQAIYYVQEAEKWDVKKTTKLHFKGEAIELKEIE